MGGAGVRRAGLPRRRPGGDDGGSRRGPAARRLQRAAHPARPPGPSHRRRGRPHAAVHGQPGRRCDQRGPLAFQRRRHDRAAPGRAGRAHRLRAAARGRRGPVVHARRRTVASRGCWAGPSWPTWPKRRWSRPNVTCSGRVSAASPPRSCSRATPTSAGRRCRSSSIRTVGRMRSGWCVPASPTTRPSGSPTRASPSSWPTVGARPAGGATGRGPCSATWPGRCSTTRSMRCTPPRPTILSSTCPAWPSADGASAAIWPHWPCCAGPTCSMPRSPARP